MTNFGTSIVRPEMAQISIQDTCRHRLKVSECKKCLEKYTNSPMNHSFMQPLSRARMFSPSSCVTNVRNFRKQVLKSKKDKEVKNSSDDNYSDISCDEMISPCIVDPKHLDTMKKIHRKLIDKTSKLVERAKQSRFLGFFSPTQLRNRIKLGNLSQIPCSFIIHKRRAFSPNVKSSNLINEYSTISRDYNYCHDKSSFIDSTNSNLPKQYTYSRASKLKSKTEKLKDLKCNMAINANEDFFLTKQKIELNFPMASKLVLS